MKKYIYLNLFALVLMASCSSEFTTPPPVIPPDALEELIISEIATYINTDATAGGVRNHYVEIYNGSDKDIDLSNYAIGYQATTDTSTLVDWDFSSSSNYLQLTGTLATLKAYVIASPLANTTAVKRDLTWGTSSTLTADASKPLQLSGNSGIALLKKDAAGTHTLNGEKYIIIDVFGSPNVARVISTGATSSRNNFIWLISGVTDTRNRTFWRKSTVIKPQTDWNLSRGTSAADSEWNVSEDRLWDYSNVGIFTK
ncbi:lamin tail domain-containing protein [Flavobacterium sp.]|jgi:predicted extracellular nuclease|uniref:lamin tail domain-containing protein n=1 Tax=Flavobacterium sp. TaxID=239 RepID=UPI0037C15908